MKWFKARLRTRRALRALKAKIDIDMIEQGINWSISYCSRMERGDVLDQIASRKPTAAQLHLINLCKEYLIVKRIGADAAVLHKLAEVR